MSPILWPAIQGAYAIWIWLIGSSADKAGDPNTLLMQQRQWCCKLTDPPPLLHGRMAALHTFCHFTKTCGACWWQMLHSTCPRGHKWPFGLSFLFFFPSHKELFVWRWPPMQPQAPWWSWRLLLLVFWDHIYLRWIVSVCTWEELSELDVCVFVYLHVNIHDCGCACLRRCLTNSP